jgi:hypothetical protein
MQGGYAYIEHATTCLVVDALPALEVQRLAVQGVSAGPHVSRRETREDVVKDRTTAIIFLTLASVSYRIVRRRTGRDLFP